MQATNTGIQRNKEMHFADKENTLGQTTLEKQMRRQTKGREQCMTMDAKAQECPLVKMPMPDSKLERCMLPNRESIYPYQEEFEGNEGHLRIIQCSLNLKTIKVTKIDGLETPVHSKLSHTDLHTSDILYNNQPVDSDKLLENLELESRSDNNMLRVSINTSDKILYGMNVLKTKDQYCADKNTNSHRISSYSEHTNNKDTLGKQHGLKNIGTSYTPYIRQTMDSDKLLENLELESRSDNNMLRVSINTSDKILYGMNVLKTKDQYCADKNTNSHRISSCSEHTNNKDTLGKHHGLEHLGTSYIPYTSQTMDSDKLLENLELESRSDNNMLKVDINASAAILDGMNSLKAKEQYCAKKDSNSHRISSYSEYANNKDTLGQQHRLEYLHASEVLDSIRREHKPVFNLIRSTHLANSMFSSITIYIFITVITALLTVTSTCNAGIRTGGNSGSQKPMYQFSSTHQELIKHTSTAQDLF